MNTDQTQTNDVRKYHGVVCPAPRHLNPKATPDLYVFSGINRATQDPFMCRLRMIETPLSITLEEFAADVHAIGSLAGWLSTEPPDYAFAHFRYYRKGSLVTREVRDLAELKRAQLRQRADHDLGSF